MCERSTTMLTHLHPETVRPVHGACPYQLSMPPAAVVQIPLSKGACKVPHLQEVEHDALVRLAEAVQPNHQALLVEQDQLVQQLVQQWSIHHQQLQAE